MGEWKTVYADEVEGRWVTLKVYETENDEDGDEGLAVRDRGTWQDRGAEQRAKDGSRNRCGRQLNHA
jgi:hypothetical protein